VLERFRRRQRAALHRNALDTTLPPAEAAKAAGSPMAWQQLGRQSIMPNQMR
jgi:hypothetical protein